MPSSPWCLTGSGVNRQYGWCEPPVYWRSPVALTPVSATEMIGVTLESYGPPTITAPQHSGHCVLWCCGAAWWAWPDVGNVPVRAQFAGESARRTGKSDRHGSHAHVQRSARQPRQSPSHHARSRRGAGRVRRVAHRAAAHLITRLPSFSRAVGRNGRVRTIGADDISRQRRADVSRHRYRHPPTRGRLPRSVPHANHRAHAAGVGHGAGGRLGPRLHPRYWVRLEHESPLAATAVASGRCCG